MALTPENFRGCEGVHLYRYTCDDKGNFHRAEDDNRFKEGNPMSFFAGDITLFVEIDEVLLDSALMIARLANGVEIKLEYYKRTGSSQSSSYELDADVIVWSAFLKVPIDHIRDYDSVCLAEDESGEPFVLTVNWGSHPLVSIDHGYAPLLLAKEETKIVNKSVHDTKVKYDYDKLQEILFERYHKFSKSSYPTETFQKLVACMDDAFVDEWCNQVQAMQEKIANEFNDAATSSGLLMSEIGTAREQLDNATKRFEAAVAKLGDIESPEMTDTVKYMAIATENENARVDKALAVYKDIVGMKFKDPEMTLANIKNASYFIWALYAKEGGSPANMLGITRG